MSETLASPTSATTPAGMDIYYTINHDINKVSIVFIRSKPVASAPAHFVISAVPIIQPMALLEATAENPRVQTKADSAAAKKARLQAEAEGHIKPSALSPRPPSPR
jgi:hypothetical protein